MKFKVVLSAALIFMICTGIHAQQLNRGDICQDIPGLTTEQQQKIDKLGAEHQQRMDVLRTQFQSEANAQDAANIKTQMNSEMQSHYNNISAVLTPEQKSWYNQSCNANTYSQAAYGRGNGRGLGRGTAYGRGSGYGRGTAYGRGTGCRRFAASGRGAGYGTMSGRGRSVY